MMVLICNWCRHTAPLSDSNIFGKTSTNVTPMKGCPQKKPYSVFWNTPPFRAHRATIGAPMLILPMPTHPNKNVYWFPTNFTVTDPLPLCANGWKKTQTDLGFIWSIPRMPTALAFLTSLGTIPICPKPNTTKKNTTPVRRLPILNRLA